MVTYDPPAWLRVVYLAHAITATVGMAAGFLAFWWREDADRHRVSGRLFAWNMAVATILVIPMVIVYPDDVLTATIPLMLYLIYAGSRGDTAWSTPRGFRLLSITGLALSVMLIGLGPVRAWTSGSGGTVAWEVYGAVMWWSVWPDWQAAKVGGPRFSRRAHGTMMILAMIVAAQSVSPENLGEWVLATVPEEAFKTLPLLIGIPVLLRHLWREPLILDLSPPSE